MSTEIVKKAEEHAALETFVVARTPAEMALAQNKLLDWFERKLQAEIAEARELKRMVAYAKAHKWRSAAIIDRARRHQKRIVFYAKCAKIVKAGYYLVPSFPIEVFAIRVKRPRPIGSGVESTWGPPSLNDENAQVLPAGHGRFVSAEPTAERATEEREVDGQKKKYHLAWPDEFQEPEFPIQVATPLVMKATARAQAERLFDEIGLCPARRTRKADPMVIGRVLLRDGYRSRELNFLIGWCVDHRTL